MTYFHELTDERFEVLNDLRMTWAEIVENYRQPSWCAYHLALNGQMGCWSLTGRRIRAEGDCKDCDLYWPNLTGEV